MGARFIVADVFDGIASLDDGSIDMVMSSPPFLALRSYLPEDHPNKGREIGSEPTPADFIDTMIDVVEAIEPKLAPHGSLVFELGDTYSGSGGAGGDYGWDRLGQRGEQPDQPSNFRRKGQVFEGSKRQSGRSAEWPLAKSLCLIPESFRWALVYGRNPFNGRETEPWRVRNVVRWHRPNPPVGALGDKFRPATSEMVIACKSKDRYFDLDAVRTAPVVQMGREVSGNNIKGSDTTSFRFSKRVDSNPAGVPPLDTWIIATAPYSGSHYATYPPALCVKPILAMCPEKVCTVCGEPSRRITGEALYVDSVTGKVSDGITWTSGVVEGRGAASNKQDGSKIRQNPTLGWTDCGHNAWRPGVVLDPFAGSGTTLSVATGHGRDAIGIDIDERNAQLALDRVGPFLLTVEMLEESQAL